MERAVSSKWKNSKSSYDFHSFEDFKFMFWKFSAHAAADFYSIREELHPRKSLIKS